MCRMSDLNLHLLLKCNHNNTLLVEPELVGARNPDKP